MGGRERGTYHTREHLDDLTERVTKVHAALESFFPQVGAQLLQHDLNREFNHPVSNAVSALKPLLDEAGPVLFQERKELSGANKSELHDLAQAIDDVPVVLCPYEGLVEQGGGGGVERADSVFLAAAGPGIEVLWFGRGGWVGG